MKLKKNILVLITIIATHLSFGEEIIVTSINDGATTDVGTFRWAVDQALPNDTIIINVKGTIALGSSIAFTTDNLTVIGPYPKHNTFTADGAFDMFLINNKSNINFKGLGFLDCDVLSVIKVDDSYNINFKDCVFENSDCSDVPLKINSSEVIFLNTSFVNNDGDDAGVAYVSGTNSNGFSTFYNCTFFNNSSATSGGAVRAINNQVNLYNNLFKGNQHGTGSYTGMALYASSAIFNYANNIFVGNSTDGTSSGTGKQIDDDNFTNDQGGNRIVLNDLETSPFSHANSYSVAENTLYLSANIIEDGYGLKYFRITDGSSSLVNQGQTVVLPPGDKDCRRAPRVNPSTMPNIVIDVGPFEYTPYIVKTNALTGTNSLPYILNNLTSGADNFVEFDIQSFNPTNAIELLSTLDISQSVYIDGFSQPGSAIAGPDIDGGTGVTPADSLIHITTTGTATTGINVNASNVTIAGLEIYGFNGYGITNTQNNFNLYGCHIGFYKSGSFFINGCTISGVLVNTGSNIQIGGNEHWQRNVISANGGALTSTSNIRIGSATTSVKIIGNFIGLHPTGNSALSLSNNNAQGVLFTGTSSSTSQITIGESSFLTRNIISGNKSNGIKIDSNTTLNINNNYIGLNYNGTSAIANTLSGIYISNSNSTINIGTVKGNVISGNLGEGIEFINSSNALVLNNIIGLAVDITAKPNAKNGILIDNSQNISIGNNSKGNIISGNTQNGIKAITNSDTITITNNRIGTSPSGLAVKPNSLSGINIANCGTINIIDNVISGNTQNGIFLSGTSNAGSVTNVEKNKIGTDVIGSTALPNESNGIHIQNTHNATIGSIFPDNNVISGNTLNGILVESPNVAIDGNIIGLGKNYEPNLGNLLNGIEVTSTANNIHIGEFGKNYIGENTKSGIFLNDVDNVRIDNCRLGTDNSAVITSLAALGNGESGIYVKNCDSTIIGNFPTPSSSVVSNLIVDNATGILLENSTNTVIYRNRIGAQNVGNTDGIKLIGTSTNNNIGYLSGNRNVITHNTTGILFDGSDVQNNHVKGNFIGINGIGSTTAGNGIGIHIKNGATNNKIGEDGGQNRKNWISSNSVAGIKLEGVINNRIYHNLIGSNLANIGSPNTIGVWVLNCTSANNIGMPSQFNYPIVSGNTTGIVIDNSNSQIIQNCRIGTSVDGLTPLPNTHGIIIQNSSSDNIIGGSGLNERNLISGNDSIGVYIKSGCGSNEVKGNLFGTDIDTNATNGLENLIGIAIENNTSSNTIGGTTSEGNTFSNTNEKSIYINNSSNQKVEGNRFGLKIGNTPLGSANGTVGIYLKNSNNNTIGNTTSNKENTLSNLSIGILIDNSDNNTILNNFIGTDTAGTSQVNGINGIGIRIDSTASNNQIGPNNVISDNTIGVKIQGVNTKSNKVFGNKIGTNLAGTSAITNSFAIAISDQASYNIIGGDRSSNDQNIISGNSSAITLFDANNNIISGNNIGSNAAGNSVISNSGSEHIVFNNSSNNQFGGSTTDSTNYVTGANAVALYLSNNSDTNKIVGNKFGELPDGSAGGNSDHGILIHNSSSNIIGSFNQTDLINEIENSVGDGVSITGNSTNNKILNNSIHDNGGLAIDINNDGPTANNTTAIQNGIEMPEIIQAFDCNGGTNNVQVAVVLKELTVGDNYIIEFYDNTGNTDVTGYGEANTFIQRFTHIANSTQDTVSFALGNLSLNTIISASLTYPNSGTSEMSKNDTITNAPPTPTYTVNNETCNGSNDGSVTVNAIDAQVVSDGSTTQNLGLGNASTTFNLSPGNYTFITGYFNGCLVNSSQLTINAGPTPGFTFVTTNDTCGLGIGSIVITNTTTTLSGTTQYTIDNGTNLQLNNNFTGLSGGSYNSFMTINITGFVCSSDTQSIAIYDINLATNGEMDFTYDDFCASSTGVVTTPPSFTNGTYSVTPTVGNINPTTGDITGVTAGTTYTITYSYGNTCNVDQTFTPLNPVDASFSYDNVFNTTDSLCFGEELAPSTTNPGGTFTISGFANPTIDNTGVITNAIEGQTYSVEYITSNTGCPDTSSVAVFILPLPVQPNITTADTLLCLDDTVQVLTSNIVTDWYINSPTSIALNVSPIISYQPENSDVPNGTTTFYAYYFDANGCASPYDSINITRVDNSNISLIDSVDICLGSEVELSAQNAGVAAYFWSNNIGVDDSTDPTIIVSPNEKTYYFVTLTTAEGCIINDSILVTIKAPSDCNVDTYTAFSPNGDNVNDTWIIDGIEGFKENSVYIYNRWGDLIQKIDNYDNASNVWDGKTKFGTAPAGTYFYIVEANGTKALTGWVQIVK